MHLPSLRVLAHSARLAQPARQARARRWAGASIMVAMLLAGVTLGRGSTTGGVHPTASAQSGTSEDTVQTYLPMLGKNLLRPWSRPKALPSATPMPTTDLPTPEVTAEPTRDTRRAAWPRDAATIVLQLGRSETSQPGEAWEEMNGTPYLTLYGDGRLIAGRYLLGFDQSLYETQLDEAQMNALLVPLHFDVDVFTLRSLNSHPRNSQFVGHLYMRFGSGDLDFKRTRVTGIIRWQRDDAPPEGVPDAERVKALVDWMFGLEESLTEALESPYEVERYTIIAHEVLPSGSAPAWPLGLDVKAISDSAPLRTADGHVHGPPGHRFVDAAEGAPVREATVREAKAHHPGQNSAAAYTTRGTRNHVVVGARPEVPGGSLFLPERVHDRWYRDDSGG